MSSGDDDVDERVVSALLGTTADANDAETPSEIPPQV